MRVVLPELDRIGTTVDLEANLAAALATTNLVETRPEGSGRWAVTSQRSGVQVLPKVGISRLLFLPGYVTDPCFRPEDVPAQPEPDVWPALAESSARQAERAHLCGVRQGYVTADDSLALVRGRIRVAQIARRRGILLPLEVRYDDYSPDIPENQILRSACRLMSGLDRLDSRLQARLVHLDARLDGVSVLRRGEPLPAWRVTRTGERRTRPRSPARRDHPAASVC